MYSPACGCQSRMAHRLLMLSLNEGFYTSCGHPMYLPTAGWDAHSAARRECSRCCCRCCSCPQHDRALLNRHAISHSLTHVSCSSCIRLVYIRLFVLYIVCAPHISQSGCVQLSSCPQDSLWQMYHGHLLLLVYCACLLPNRCPSCSGFHAQAAM